MITLQDAKSEVEQPNRKHPRSWAKGYILTPLVLLLLCISGVVVFLFMPELPWTAQSFAVNASVCGRWEVIARPNLGFNVSTSSFNSIGVASIEDIWFTGTIDNFDDSEQQPLIVRWKGEHFRDTYIPPGDWLYSGMDGVAAVTQDDVWVIGHDYWDKLLMRWDGDHWSRVPLRSGVNPVGPYLNAVAAVTKNDVWIAGCCDASNNSSVMMHWNGKIWDIIPYPTTPATSTVLSDIAVIAVNDIWVVGSHDEANTLITHWNGSIWEVVPSPNLCKVKNTLVSVSAIGANDVWAVGACSDEDTGGRIAWGKTLIEHWDGTRWSIVQGPGLLGPHQLTGVAAISPDDVWAVGVSWTNANYPVVEHTVVMHWDGKQWSVIPSPNQSSAQSFYDVAAVSKDEIWAVGESENQVFSARFIRTACPTP